MNSDNPMRKIQIDKITFNVGAGKDEKKMIKGIKLLEKISGMKAVKTITSKRIPTWGLRPGLAVGVKVTVRGKGTQALLKRLLFAKSNVISPSSFDNNGNLSFGIPEYIDIEGEEYDPEIKMFGLEVAVTLKRPGFRVNRRKLMPSKVGKNHKIKKEEAIEFIKSFGITVGDDK